MPADPATVRDLDADLAAPTTDRGDQATDEGVEAGSDRLDAGEVSASTPNSPSVAGSGGVLLPEAPPDPLTAAELDAIVTAIWDGLDGDPFRVGDLLADALGFIGGLALRTDHHVAERATGLLRRMEQRALWGPEHPAEVPPVRIIWAETP